MLDAFAFSVEDESKFVASINSVSAWAVVYNDIKIGCWHYAAARTPILVNSGLIAEMLCPPIEIIGAKERLEIAGE